MQRTITIPPLPPVIACILAAVGIFALSRVLPREWRRVNAQRHAHELDIRERDAAAVARRDLPTLRLDPVTGVYRPV
jgi:hypothetical protein